MKLIGKGLLILTVFFVSIMFVNAADPGTEYGECYWGNTVCQTSTQADCQGSGETWVSGKCAASYSDLGKCASEVTMRSPCFESTSSDSICSTKISDTPADGTSFCKCGSRIYAITDPGYCVDGTYTPNPPATPPGDDFFIGNKKYWQVNEVSGAALVDRAHYSSCPPNNCPSNGNGDGASWWAVVYVNETRSVSFSIAGVDDWSSYWFYPLVSSITYAPNKPIDGTIFTFNTANNTLYTHTELLNPPGPHPITMSNIPKGWYLFRIQFDDTGGNDRYFYDFKFIDSVNNLWVNYGRYFRVFHANELLTVTGYPDLRQMDLSELDFNGYIDGDEDEYTCATLLGKSWAPDAEWDSTFNSQRRCCGDDASNNPDGDLLYVNTKSQKICTQENGWESLSGQTSCPGGVPGVFSYEIVSALGTDYNPLASNGLDGCCGDDNLCKFNDNYCQSLTTFSECVSPCTWDSGFCMSAATNNALCLELSDQECRTTPYCSLGANQDYGYVTPNNDYLCYNNHSKFIGAQDKWSWIPAPERAFLITPLNFSGKTVDYISNSREWYYCNAAPSSEAKGEPVPEYGSFPAPPIGGMTSMSCSLAAYYLTGEIHTDCQTGSRPCCVDDMPIDILNDPSSIDTCECARYASSFPNEPFCDHPDYQDHPICSSSGQGADRIITEFCLQNPLNCVDLNQYAPDSPCGSQPTGDGRICEIDEICINGVTLPTTLFTPGDQLCCIGSNADCMDRDDIIDESTCELAGGEVYSLLDEFKICSPPTQIIPLSEETACCTGALSNRNDFLFSYFESINNNTFSCYAHQGNNYFAQCCYGLCENMNQFANPGISFVDQTRNRVFALKSSYNTYTSYDIYDVDLLTLVDESRRKNTALQITHPLDYILYFGKNVSLYFYDFIEFDVLYNNEGLIGDVYINDVNYGPLIDYTNNGDKGGVPHHIKITIRPENKYQQLYSIKIVLEGINNDYKAQLLYDNIYLGVEDDGLETSLNRYCTGGFASWIPDLDPPISIPSSSEFFIGDDAWMLGYGRYAETCRLNLPYGWTGHYCCGDDTDGTNYGEYFNDQGTVPTWSNVAGCFYGTTIPVGEPVWKQKGYLDYSARFFSKNNELITYPNSDLIYNATGFLGCQVPQGKYSYLRTSYTGFDSASSPLLMTASVDDQCTVIGRYYCMNGIWREYVPGLDRDMPKNYYEPSIPSSLELKSVPPATNLIKNGEFGGPCPAGVCDGNPIIYEDQ